MGVAIPQVVASDRATGAQVIDGSLKFNEDTTTVLERTNTRSAANAAASVSVWVKRSTLSSSAIYTLLQYESGGTFAFALAFYSDYVYAYDSTTQDAQAAKSDGLLRDVNSWYHIFYSRSNGGTDGTLYINGVEQSTKNSVATSIDWLAYEGQIGYRKNGATRYYDGFMSQLYVIDGQQLSPSDFGFTDPLTNTWKPKKYEGTFGTDGFYLPMDGNSPIGEDKSGITTPNNGTFWSRYVTISEGNTGTNYNEDATAWFDGDTSTAASLYSGNMVSPYSPTTVVFTPPSPITVSTGVRVYISIDRGQNISINGTETNASVSAGWNDTGFTGTLTSLTLGPTNAGSSSNPAALEIDGVILVDGLKGNSWTPVNFGGSVALDNPIVSGALPILNTTQGGTQAGVGVRTDPNYANLVLALPLVGNANDVSNQINSGSTTKVVTVDGAVASSAFSNFYGGSFEFDGTNDDLTIPDSADFNFGADDFTMEMWVYSDASQTKEIMGQRGAGVGGAFSIYHTGDNILLYVGSNGSSWDIVAGATIATNVVGQWTHIAIVRTGNHFLTFQDGVHKSTTVDDGTVQDSSSPLSIGSNDGTYFFDGKLSDIRIYKGVAKYTSDFVVPATSPHILPDTPSGVSGSSKLAKITDGAVSFNGTSDYLTVPYSSDFVLDGDFTIECFVYFLSGSVMVDFSSEGSYADAWQLYNQTPTFYGYSSSGNASMTSDTPLSRGWNHLVVTRTISNNTARMFINGVQTASSTSFSHTYGNDTSNVLMVGAQSLSGPTAYFTGQISSLRITKGTALYTSNFTPPTAPLTEVTNTKLLCCQSNTSALIPAVNTAEGSYTLTGVNYSSGNQVTGSAGLTGEDNIFNGKVGQYTDTDNYATVTHTNDNYILWTPTNSISYTSKVEIYCYAANGFGITNSYSLNGAAEVTFTGGIAGYNNATWIEVATGSGTLTSLKLRLQRDPNNSGAAWYAVRIDGTVLVNDFNGKPILGGGSVAATNFNPFNTDINTVRGQETGYATLNPFINGASTLSDGNLTATAPSGTTHGTGRSTLTMDTSGTGKFYFEATLIVTGGTYPHIGVLDSVRNTDAAQVGSTTNCFSYMTTGNVQLEGASASAYGDTYTVGDTIGCSLDCGSGELRFYKNGVDQGVAKTITTNYHACFAVSNYGSSGQWKVNFGQKPFKFPPPDGYQTLNTANTRPVKVISRPDQYVGVSTWTADGTQPLSITNYNFKPDLIWMKSTSNAYNHHWHDSVRGINNFLVSNDASSTDPIDTQSDTVTSFDLNGFTMGTNSNGNYTGTGGSTHVGWCWKAGGNKNTFNVDDVGYATASAAGLTGGGYAVTGASVGTKQGFSIIQWEHDGTAGGYSMPHGLTQTPKFIITRNIDITSNWGSYHYNYDDGAGTYGLNFNSNSVPSAQAGWWNDTAPTNTQFSLGTFFDDTGTFIAYLWHDVPGLQKFGTYQGNGSADGPFVELGFRPAIVMVKYAAATGSANWFIYDSERGKFNPNNASIMPNSGNEEENSYDIDFFSNGFKLRYADTLGYTNYSDKYIYCAWAEAPSIDLYGGGANAR